MRVQTCVSDCELIAQFRSGSIAAFEEIVERYEAKVFNLALRFTRSQEDAEEVLQDVFSTVYRKVTGFEGKAAFSSWLYRVVVNASFMKLRKRKRTHAMSLDGLTPNLKQQFIDQDVRYGSRLHHMNTASELREVLQDAINKLPDQYRAVFVLRDVDGLSNQEVGDLLNLTIPAVKSRLHRSRIMLRRRLQRSWDEYKGKLTPDSLQEERAANS